MKKLYKALADFQQEVPTIHKGTKGYGYSYADLPSVFETINPVMKKHNLGFTQLIQGDYINTVIFHTESGESISSNIDIPQNVILKGMNEFQVMGSAITYLRRYALSSALGLVTDIDTDASTPPTTPPTRKQKPQGMKQEAKAFKADTRKPSKPKTSTQVKATTEAQKKASHNAPTKAKIEKEGDQTWLKAKMSVIEGVRTLDQVFNNINWASDELKEKFKKAVGQNHE